MENTIKNELISKFVNPNPLSRPVAFWFLDGQVSPEEIEYQIAAMKSQDVHAVIPQKGSSRLQLPYLSEAWFKTYGEIYAAASRHQVQVWIYDEGSCPSGSVEKKLAQEERFKARAIVCEPRQVQDKNSIPVPEGTLLGVSVQHDDGIWREVLSWLCPEGIVIPKGESRPDTVYFFMARAHVLKHGNFTHGDVDRTNPEAVETFLDLTHREYAHRFGDKLGSVITGVFTDEPAMFEQPAFASNFMTEFRWRKGYDFRPYLPALYFDMGPETIRARCDFYDTISSLYADIFFGKAAKWCQENNLVYTGHLWGEEYPDVMMRLQGDFFRIYRQMAYPGVDCISGSACGSRKQNPAVIKLASSASHVYGKKRTMCEAFAGTTQTFKYQEMKWMTNWLMVCGIDLLVLHVFYYTMEGNTKRYSSPSLFFQSPTWPHFHLYSDYVGRVSEMLQAGTHVADVAVLYPMNSIWANTASPLGGHVKNVVRQDRYGYVDAVPECPEAVKPIVEAIDAVTDRLMNEQIDFDYLDSDILREAVIKDGMLNVNAETYSTLILPYVSVESIETMRKIEDFAQNGGQVIAYGAIPQNSSSGEEENTKLRVISERLFSEGGSGVFIKDDSEKMVEAMKRRDVVIRTGFRKTRDRNIHYQHRRTQELDIYFLTSHSDQRETIQASFCATSQPELWNPEDGHRYQLTGMRADKGRTEIELHFEPYESYFIVFSPKDDGSLPRWQTKFSPVLHLDRDWNIEFLPNKGHRYLDQFDKLFTFGSYVSPLYDWSNFGMSYFSGSARYVRKFVYHGKMREKIFLDLGRVEQTAEAVLNSCNLGVRIWHPYRFYISDALQVGENLLEVTVSNTLGNIFFHPEFEKAEDWEETSQRTAAEQLVSGLLGPVRLCVPTRCDNQSNS